VCVCVCVCLCTRARPLVHLYISEISTYLLIPHLKSEYLIYKQRPLGSINVAGRATRKHILTAWDGRVWSGLIWLRTRLNTLMKKRSSSNIRTVNISLSSRCIMAQAVSGRFLRVGVLGFDPRSVQVKFFFFLTNWPWFRFFSNYFSCL
jgi:hypothetical protein